MQEILLEWTNECHNPLCHGNPTGIRMYIFCNSLMYHGQIDVKFSWFPNFFQQPRLQMLRKWLFDLSYIYITFDVSRTFSSCAPRKFQSTWLDSKAQSHSQYYWHIFELTKSIEWFTQVFSMTVHMFTLWQDDWQDWYILKWAVRNRLEGL